MLTPDFDEIIDKPKLVVGNLTLDLRNVTSIAKEFRAAGKRVLRKQKFAGNCNPWGPLM